MILLRQLFKFFELLHSETASHQLCWGFVVGMSLGLTPTLTLHWFAIALGLFVLKINIGAALLSYPLFLTLSFALDPLFHKLGFWLLVETQGLHAFWAQLYSMAIVPFTRFNNTIVLGSTLVSLLLALPLFLFTQSIVRRYRETIVRKIRGSILWRTWTATKLFRLYAQYQQYKS